jgi:hypothetical protein
MVSRKRRGEKDGPGRQPQGDNMPRSSDPRVPFGSAAAPSLDPRLVAMYETLGVAPDAADDQVRKAYRGLALKLHPDKTGNDPAKSKEYAGVKDAYEAITAHRMGEDPFADSAQPQGAEDVFSGFSFHATTAEDENAEIDPTSPPDFGLQGHGCTMRLPGDRAELFALRGDTLSSLVSATASFYFVSRAVLAIAGGLWFDLTSLLSWGTLAHVPMVIAFMIFGNGTAMAGFISAIISTSSLRGVLCRGAPAFFPLAFSFTRLTLSNISTFPRRASDCLASALFRGKAGFLVYWIAVALFGLWSRGGDDVDPVIVGDASSVLAWDTVAAGSDAGSGSGSGTGGTGGDHQVLDLCTPQNVWGTLSLLMMLVVWEFFSTIARGVRGCAVRETVVQWSAKTTVFRGDVSQYTGLMRNLRLWDVFVVIPISYAVVVARTTFFLALWNSRSLLATPILIVTFFLVPLFAALGAVFSTLVYEKLFGLSPRE